MSLKLGGINPDQNSSLLSVIIIAKSYCSVYQKERGKRKKKKKRTAQQAFSKQYSPVM